MDTLRGTFGSDSSADRSWEESEEDPREPARTRDLPPLAIGQDERRMQVRAYNHWASLLGDRLFPNIAHLDPDNLPDFGPHSVLLDFSFGIDNPVVRFLGDRLAHECSANGAVITRLSDVPPRSLLSRITDHYMQILANQAPIGFEAEFINHTGTPILYRGILLPFSSDDATIDFIYGVINWKEMADQLTADELLLEIDQALELGAEFEAQEDPAPRAADPVTDWADSPAHEEADDLAGSGYNDFAKDFAPGFASLAPRGVLSDEDDDLPDFSQYGLDDDDEEYDEDGEEGDDAGYNFASLADYIEAPTKKAIDLTAIEPLPFVDEGFESGYGSDYGTDYAPEQGYEPEPEPAFAPPAAPEPVFEPLPEPVLEVLPEPAPEPLYAEEFEVEAEVEVAPETAIEIAGEAENETENETENADEGEEALAGFADDLGDDAGLYDCLAAARELARAADSTEDRSRSALYAAVSRAYDFSLAAKDAPEDYAELIADAGLTVQDRAPMTPVVKLVFGHDYDKTRLTEYAAVLSHAHRLKLVRGSLAGYLSATEGGVKAIVKAERRLRREEQGKPVEDAAAVREALAQALRALQAISLEELDGAGPEFALALIRRDEIGCAEILAEIPEDVAMIERAARKIVG